MRRARHLDPRFDYTVRASSIEPSPCGAWVSVALVVVGCVVGVGIGGLVVWWLTK